MRASIRNSIMGTMTDLDKIGPVDEITMKNIGSLFLPEIKDYSAATIIALRKRTKLSQAAFAAVVNVFPSTVQKWERGIKKPTGASQRLFDIIDSKGLAGIL